MAQTTVVFIDGGYLCTAAGVALCGAAPPRDWIKIEPREFLRSLQQRVMEIVPDAELPPTWIYWHDGYRQQSLERLGVNINQLIGKLEQLPDGSLRQREVDTAIVSNVIEATNKRDLTTILVTGDRDIGPTIEPLWRAGKKLHLLFVENSEKQAVNFSSRIRQTATECGFACHGWNFADISKIFSVAKIETPTRQDFQSEQPPHHPHPDGHHHNGHHHNGQDDHVEYGPYSLAGQMGTLLQFHGREDVIHPERGFGFLRPDKIPPDGVERIFVHFSSLPMEVDYHALRPGTRVEFSAKKGELGWQATQVVPLPGQKPEDLTQPGMENQMGILLQFHGREDVIHPERGFGFLKPDTAPEVGVDKIFVHFSALPRDIDYRLLKPGMRVGFSAKKIDQRWNATKVDLLF